MAFDTRTEKNIATLVPKAQAQARLFVQAVLDSGITIKIIDGSRSFRAQDILHRDHPEATRARGGYSNHNFGIAWDIGIFDNNRYVPESPRYKAIGKIGRDLGLEWGGDWTSFVDEPHFQCKTGKSIAQLRALVLDNGGDISKPAAKAAIDALVLPLGSQPHPPAAPTRTPVSVFRKSTALSLDAFLIDSRTWVSVADFTDYFGGQIVTVAGNPPTVTLQIENESVGMLGTRIDNRAFVKFADINTLFHFDFRFDSTMSRLTIL